MKILPACFSFLAALSVFGLGSIRATASPANDNLANAQVLPSESSFSVNGTQIGATQESFEQSSDFPNLLSSLRASVWYSVTPSVSGSLFIKASSTANSPYGTGTAVFRGPGTPTKATLVDSTGPGDFSLSVPVTAGQPYFIFIANEYQGAHDFVLTGTLHETGTPPPVVTPTATLKVKKPTAIRSTGAKGKVLLELSSAPTTDLTVEYKTGGTAFNGTDYKMLSGNKTIPAGATSAVIKIKPLPSSDASDSGTKTVKLKLTAGEGYTVGDPAKAKIKIVDEP